MEKLLDIIQHFGVSFKLVKEEISFRERTQSADVTGIRGG
jgi:hypothetical protein